MVWASDYFLYICAVMRSINEIIIHCSATRRGQNVTVEQIDLWHRKRGFKCIGYHYVVMLDGNVVEGRPLQEIGAHCTEHNAHSVGVCYVGGLELDGRAADTRTTEQKKALRDLVARLCAQFPGATVHGHREFANKACPCFDVSREL